MTKEEAIEALSLLKVFDAPRLSEAIKMAVTALRTHPDAQPNEPLPLEELREMDGRLVYVVDRIYPPYSGWWIIGWEDGSCVLVAAKRRGTQYIVQDYGIGWVAYRRPPKEELV